MKKDQQDSSNFNRAPQWRLLAHKNGEKLEIENHGELDEVVLDPWFHLEQLDQREWWLRIGDARVLVHIGTDGKAQVDVERGFYDHIIGQTTVQKSV